MTVRNLAFVLKPKSVGVIGAGVAASSLGHIVVDNLRKGAFAGPIYPVNPHAAEVAGLAAYPNAAALPTVPELAVIATPPDTVAGLIVELAARGCRAAVVLTAGFGEGGREEGERRRAALLAAAQPTLFRIVGPNCFGVMSPGFGLNASFARTTPKAGHLGVISQSGAVTAAMIDWAQPRGIGFSHIVSVGDMVDVDFGDLLDALCDDAATHAILLYVEGITNARKFMSAARAAARIKPVLVVKAGRQAAGAKVAASHTGALAGADAVYDAAFARAGVLRVEDLDDLFDSASLLALAPDVTGDRLAIVTNGGGFGVLATDRLIAAGGRLAHLSTGTMAQLEAALPPSWSHGNPVDVIGDADKARYDVALRAVLADQGVDAVLAMHCPTAVGDPGSTADAVIAAAKQTPTRAVLAAWLGDESVTAAREAFARNGIPSFTSPSEAVRGFMDLVRYRKLRDALMEVPSCGSSLNPGVVARARALVAVAQPGWLPSVKAKELLGLYGVPCNRTKVAATPAAAAEVASAWRTPVALKIDSPDITHKSDVGGVVLNVAPENAESAGAELLARVKARVPQARIEGLMVEEMVTRSRAQELILGMTIDPTFGPIIVFGHGGTAVEIIDDKVFGLPPLNLTLANGMIAATRVGRLLGGYRDRPRADIEAVARALAGLSQLVIDHPQIVDLDINPLLADETGVIALDARIKIDPAARGRLVIGPYPQGLERDLVLSSGQKIFLRPVRPEDEALLVAFRSRMTPEDIHARFFSALKVMDRALAARLTQIDYDREMALVAFSDAQNAEVLGIARFHADPDNMQAEFAIAVRSDLHGRGLGYGLMQALIDVAASRGIGRLWGDVLADNAPMLALCRSLGMHIGAAGDVGVVRATADLKSRAAR